MRHQKHKNKLAVNPSHRKSLVRNLSIELIDHGKIKTTHAKSKAVKPYVEKLVTLAKVDTVANRRLAYKKLDNMDAVRKLFADVAPKFKTRPGGYTRITKIPDGRVGDNAPMSYISFVE
ncbi:MAG: 50S ribosomal protein L17 [Halobacteriovoraceae bacterium]|nr:50S ribosomal protein L17 [Halobacteriovoraceae bacterium]